MGIIGLLHGDVRYVKMSVSVHVTSRVYFKIDEKDNINETKEEVPSLVSGPIRMRMRGATSN